MYHLATFIALLFNVYLTMLIARIILSWLPHNKHHFIISIIHDLTDPYLDIFKELRLNFGGMDFSSVVAYMVLNYGGAFILQNFFPYSSSIPSIYLVSVFFKAIYFSLLVRAITNFLRYKQTQMLQPFKFILEVFELITDFLCKPFSNIFYIKYDLSAILAVTFFIKIGEPISQYLFGLCLQLLALI